MIEQKIHDNQLLIFISDNGPGVNQALKNKIFERFYTDRISSEDQHTGLGLSIAKNIIESFGGTIKLSGIDSDKYLGACFQIILPLKD